MLETIHAILKIHDESILEIKNKVNIQRINHSSSFKLLTDFSN